ncbi:hypothetical protein DGo_PE0069 (plasmid) [Deinococcus gobiensis I-0]|uniref:Uncharacterized protein n=1 Tax=Deinococcus gobiensis (strain DSM 21396 / JCM 16679 / CGMCC 1.7299 / I-0) TaxID=745776 RepID=H8H3W6_DEIGI|nr:hypothetical protein DGo_PE0069 [Deinococcus gobiensis I-0]
MDNSAAGPPVVVRVAPDGLHLETGEGQALFYFVPLRESTPKTPVPWGSSWPVGVRQWVLHWPPFLGTPSAGYGVQTRELTQQYRGTKEQPDPDYPGYQVLYRGWPLYTCDLTRELVPDPVPGLWERASVNLQAFRFPEDDDDALPGDPPRPIGGP